MKLTEAFAAIGNGSSDIFSMVSAALSGPSGLEMAVGEVLGNGMFVFWYAAGLHPLRTAAGLTRPRRSVVQGLVALLSAFTVLRSEFLRDTLTYLAGLLLTFLCVMDGWVSLFEVATPSAPPHRPDSRPRVCGEERKHAR